jgi:hypothetical protein
MNREIKFRVWDKFQKKFLSYPCYFNNKNFNEFTAFDRYFKCDEDECIVQQYTGLKDKNGKEIYEGDILLDDAKIPLKCFYDNGKFMAGISYASQEWFSECESIGNIFENKDLLK